MKTRPEVYETYWKFAALRQNVFFRRIEGGQRPWTDDPVLREFKFCNTYRASDRVSQYLIRHVIYGEELDSRDVVFRILLFKIFNKIETWQLLEAEFGLIRYDGFDYNAFDAVLDSSRKRGNAIYSNAYMSCANKAYGFNLKHQNHLALIKQMNHTDRIAERVMGAGTLAEVFRLLRAYPLIGDFMAYQLAIDLNYSEVIDFSENDFTIPGPGAVRGIAKCFVDVGRLKPEEVILWMVNNQDAEFRRLGIDFQDLWGRPLHAIDCQGLFCETDKYSRARFPELKSNRKRIKARFTPSPEPLQLFYPPKWGINERVQNAEIKGAAIPDFPLLTQSRRGSLRDGTVVGA